MVPKRHVQIFVNNGLTKGQLFMDLYRVRTWKPHASTCGTFCYGVLYTIIGVNLTMLKIDNYGILYNDGYYS